jgi:predicted molibdopterin-dependent oxidoreductase YjgC
MPKLRDRLAQAGQKSPDSVKFLVSAHASNEELFLFRRLTEELLGPSGPSAIAVSWRVTTKQQPARTTFTVPAVDAPNVNGARAFGLVPGAVGDPQGPSNLAALQAAVAAGSVTALYVFDPGPEGSLGDVQWVLDARAAGRLPLLIVQGVLLTPLARSADFLLPGGSSVEKDASYTNDRGLLQATARALTAPADAREDWHILVDLASALGVQLGYTSAASVRGDIAARVGDTAGLAGIDRLAFGSTVSARTWLQASNPSERWKWDFMYQDLPPVKGAVEPSSLPPPLGLIPLKEVK